MTSDQQALLDQDARYHERRSKDFGVGGGVPQMHGALAAAIRAALALAAVVREYQDAAKLDDDVRFSAAAAAVLDYPVEAPKTSSDASVTVPRAEWDALQAEVEKARLTHARRRP